MASGDAAPGAVTVVVRATPVYIWQVSRSNGGLGGIVTLRTPE